MSDAGSEERIQSLGDPQDPTSQTPDAISRAFAHHPRAHASFRWVYPVLSRRSGGISIGVNLNPDKICNYDCPYCQVDRRGTAPSGEVDPAGVAAELGILLEGVRRTGLEELYPGVDASRRKLVDIALSGDGEPTLRREFPEVCRLVSQARREWCASGGKDIRLVVISNATLLDSPRVREGLAHLCQDGHGEVWGKLDAGTQQYHDLVNVSRVPLSRVVEQLSGLPGQFPLRIQTLFFRYGERIPDLTEIDAWLGHLETILRKRPLLGLQLHTVARATAKAGCHPLPLEWLEQLAMRVRQTLSLLVETHGGIDNGSIGDPGKET